MTTRLATQIALAALSTATREAFVNQLADIYEHSPWIPERAWTKRPFISIETLWNQLQAVVAAASVAEKLSLIQAHPELAGHEAESATLTTASSQEQHGAGLDQCSRDESLRLQALNQVYRQRFGFPVIVAVTGLSREEIINTIAVRQNNSWDSEFNTCLKEIGKIARIRLYARFSPADNTP